MNDIDINKFKEAWKSEQAFEKSVLSKSDIQSFLNTTSKNLSKVFRKGLGFDIVLKTILGISFIILCFLLRGDKAPFLISLILFLGIVITILFQAKVFNRVPHDDFLNSNLRTIIDTKINFYTTSFIKSLYIGALSNSLFFVSGAMYYFYFKYEGIVVLDLNDLLVLGFMVIINFIFGAFFQIKQYNFQIHQLEICLTEIDENTINDLTLNSQKNKSIRRFLMAILVIICGLLILLFLIFIL